MYNKSKTSQIRYIQKYISFMKTLGVSFKGEATFVFRSTSLTGADEKNNHIQDVLRITTYYIACIACGYSSLTVVKNQLS